MNYGFLRDINGDKCQKTLLGMIVAITWITICATACFYGLKHEVKSASFITEVLLIMATVIGALFGYSTFQKIRPTDGVEDEQTNKNN